MVHNPILDALLYNGMPGAYSSHGLSVCVKGQKLTRQHGSNAKHFIAALLQL